MKFQVNHVQPVYQRVGIAQWLECQTRDRKVGVRVPAEEAGNCSSPWSTFCADSYFDIHATPTLRQ